MEEKVDRRGKHRTESLLLPTLDEPSFRESPSTDSGDVSRARSPAQSMKQSYQWLRGLCLLVAAGVKRVRGGEIAPKTMVNVRRGGFYFGVVIENAGHREDRSLLGYKN